ncbi:type IV pilin protein [Elusimicrobiota bacterium]
MNCGTEAQQAGGQCPSCHKPTDFFIKKGGSGGTILIVLGVMFAVGIVVTGILAAVAIPKFAELVRKSSEGATKGNLGAVRSALSIYYGDMEGVYPQDPNELTVDGKYLGSMPRAKTPNLHPDSSQIALIPSPQALTDEGGWAYVNNPMSPDFGSFFINCSHTDSKGSLWSSY